MSDEPDTLTSVRTGASAGVWVLAVAAAFILATGAMLVALDASTKHTAIRFVVTTCELIDFNQVISFDPGSTVAEQQDAYVRTVLVNWGLAAVVYLAVGKLLERAIRPREPSL